MVSQETERKLIPIFDNELKVSKNETDFANLSITKLDPLLITNSPLKPHIGDFSQNSIVFVDLIDQEQESDENYKVFDETVYDLNQLEKTTELYSNDVSNVYMKSILDLFRSLNFKIENISQQKSTDKQVLEEVQNHLLLNDSNKALNIINKHCGDIKPEINNLYEKFINDTLKEILLQIRVRILDIEDVVFNIKNIYYEAESKLLKKIEENDRLMNIINKQSKDHKGQVDMLVAENSTIKDKMIEIVNSLDSEAKIDSQLQEDIIYVLESRISRKLEVIAKMKKDCLKKDEIIQRYQNKAQDFEISHLSTQIAELKISQRKVQDENLNLSQILGKMSEKNTKLKQELVLFNNEYKRSVKMIKVKNEAINRQKLLIEMFQEKLSGTENFPIADLKRKKQDIETRLEMEKDYFVKQTLKKEKQDCEKRLSDFLGIKSRKI